jgi:HPt (histidine-containing phosphotransfer) domain-containing protein
MPRTSNTQGAKPAAAARDGGVPIDHSVLDKLLCDDREAVGVVLRQFCASCPGDASALGVALSRNDNKGALRWAHRLKGACQMVGAGPLADACERAEEAVHAGDSRKIADAVSEIDRETARITAYLEAWLKSGS